VRYFLEIAFVGTNYYGWQRQPTEISIQEVIEDCLTKLLGNTTNIVGAGRTDAGVHATQIMAHFEYTKELDIDHLFFRMNRFLPKDISIKNIYQVIDSAHARFDALQRTYEYKMSFQKDPFKNGLTYYTSKVPNVDRMNEAAKILFEYNDFQCFSKSKTDVKTYLCSIERANWTWQDQNLVFTISSDRFLRNMVRAIVGTLLAIGYDKMNPDELHNIIQSKNRSKAGASVPAHGLYLTSIIYPKNIYKIHE